MKQLREEWYRLNAISTKGMSPRELGFHIGMKSGIIKAIDILAGAELISDKGYAEATLEEAVANEINRNYHYTNTDNPIDFPKE